MTTQPEALRLADLLDSGLLGYEENAQAAAELRRLHEENERLRWCFDEWLNKTEWVQQTLRPKELGQHRADILKARIAALEQALKQTMDALEYEADVPGLHSEEKVWAAITTARQTLGGKHD